MRVSRTVEEMLRMLELIGRRGRALAVLVVGTVLGLATAAPSFAQGDVSPFFGRWAIDGETMPADAVDLFGADVSEFAITLEDDGDGFEADAVLPVFDDGAHEMDEVDAEFEPASRPGLYQPEEVGDPLDDEPLIWAAVGDASLVIGRLGFDDDSGLHQVLTVTMLRDGDTMTVRVESLVGDAPPIVMTATLARR